MQCFSAGLILSGWLCLVLNCALESFLLCVSLLLPFKEPWRGGSVLAYLAAQGWLQRRFGPAGRRNSGLIAQAALQVQTVETNGLGSSCLVWPWAFEVWHLYYLQLSKHCLRKYWRWVIVLLPFRSPGAAGPLLIGCKLDPKEVVSAAIYSRKTSILGKN